jgi:hypothetical protein
MMILCSDMIYSSARSGRSPCGSSAESLGKLKHALLTLYHFSQVVQLQMLNQCLDTAGASGYSRPYEGWGPTGSPTPLHLLGTDQVTYGILGGRRLSALSQWITLSNYRLPVSLQSERQTRPHAGF